MRDLHYGVTPSRWNPDELQAGCVCPNFQDTGVKLTVHQGGTFRMDGSSVAALLRAEEAARAVILPQFCFD